MICFDVSDKIQKKYSNRKENGEKKRSSESELLVKRKSRKEKQEIYSKRSDEWSKWPNGRNGRMANLGDMLIVYVFIKFEQKRLFI